jgi:hypothetical protein
MEYRECVDEMFLRFLGKSTRDMVASDESLLEAFDLEKLRAEIERRNTKPDWKVVVADSLQNGEVWTVESLIRECDARGCGHEVSPKMIGTWAGYTCGFVTREGDSFKLRKSAMRTETRIPRVEASEPVAVEVHKKHTHRWHNKALLEMTDGAVYSTEELHRIMTQKHEPRLTYKAVLSGMSRMSREGKVKRVKRGQYRI